ncbi:hypothetical protein KL909_004586 [Ogataea angusta]|nr:hypothetical protein KL909_004586 [Ogataea angusta]
MAKTPRGHVHAKKVVIATNAYTRALLPDFWGKITPVKGVVSHLKSESNKTLETNMVHTIPVEIDYISVQDDESLIVGGGGQTYKNPPNREMMVDNADDSYFPEETRQYFVGYASRNYKSLADVQFANDYTWTGCMGFTEDGFPYVGDLTAYGRPNMFISAGFSGHGMPRIFSCSKYLSELIMGKEPATSIPAPFMLSIERMSMETPYLDSLDWQVRRNVEDTPYQSLLVPKFSLQFEFAYHGITDTVYQPDPGVRTPVLQDQRPEDKCAVLTKGDL